MYVLGGKLVSGWKGYKLSGKALNIISKTIKKTKHNDSPSESESSTCDVTDDDTSENNDDDDDESD